MNRNSTNPKIETSSIIALLLGIGFIAVGVFNIITLRVDAKEYNKATDIRTVDALVEKCEVIYDKDSKDEWEYFSLSLKPADPWEIVAYALEISFVADGKPYTAKGNVSPHNNAFREDIQKGDTIEIEVYRTSTGQYKISPDNNPIDFLIACCLIPLGAVFSLALVYDLQRIQAVKKGQRGAVKEKQR